MYIYIKVNMKALYCTLSSFSLRRKFLILVLIQYVIITNGFNLEHRLPIVKYGHLHSHFGYSVATHTIGEAKDPNKTNCVLVGAPLDHNLQPNTSHSGALWRCPMTQSSDDCQQVITDGRRSFDSEILSQPGNDEIKEDQWMGVTVRSSPLQANGSGGKVIVCAHRYMYIVRENRYGQGLCYLLTNDLEFEEVHEPCKGRPVQRQHEDYGLCQAGTSAALLDDDTMVLGSPGPYTWRGSIWVTQVGGEYLQRDKTTYYSDHSDSSSPVDKYSYLGMSVTGGKYFGEMSYAAGAPRSQGHGQVVIFDKSNNNPIPVHSILDGEQFGSSFGYELATADVNGDRRPDLIVSAPLYFTKTEGGAVYVYQNFNDTLPLKYTLKLTGALESRFGLALANIGDLNKDNYEDLAVGAPYEGNGVVYIYLGSEQGLNAKPAQKIQASELGGATIPNGQPISTFGISISGNTDLDDNSYPDVVIGAFNSSAAVILLARPIISIQTNVSREELRNMDPNKPGCLADPTSNLTCFTFKACCSIDPYDEKSKRLQLAYSVEAETFDHLKKFSRVYFSDPENKRNNVFSKVVTVETNGIMACQAVTGYIKANTRDIQTPVRFRLKYSLVEPPLAKSALTRLNPILDQTQAHIDFEGTFQKDCGDDDLCESNLVIRAEPNITQSSDNAYTLILDETELEVRINVSNLADSAYETQLFIAHQAGVSYVATKKPTNATCNSYNTTLVACSLGNPMLRGTTTFVTIRFQPKGLEPSEKSMLFHIFANTTSKLVGRERPERDLLIQVVRRAKLNFRGWAIPEQSFYSGSSVPTQASSTTSVSDAEIQGPMGMDDVGSQVHHMFTIFNEGPSTAPKVQMVIYWPYSLYSDPQSGRPVQYLLYLEQIPTVEVSQGECHVAKEYVNPLNLASGSRENPAYLNAPAQLRMFPSQSRHSFNKSLIHSQRTYYSSSNREDHSDNSQASRNRVRRSFLERVTRLERLMYDSESSSNAGSNGKKQDIVELDCNKGTTNCVRIECEILNMPALSEAQVVVKARLWNSTLVSEYPRVERVRIFSTATAQIPEDYGVEVMDHNNIEVETRAYPELRNQQRDTSIPWLIIILGIVGGLLLLALFTYGLWKCGFFKRIRPTDPTLSGNLEKMNEEKPFLAPAKNSLHVF
ncbi:integrin alpha-PS1 isoform X2 [Drosophila eugracilis]|uniref:integrin alpha-PS1 isoform X2 n=1 Tax=Drosophila eugracilis TaxID=29029 RepID=UPI0007E7D709|nr:integrin alpha-PS1 isoform X2 [Drosophila eugracilis]